jgi:hypothetical protein
VHALRGGTRLGAARNNGRAPHSLRPFAIGKRDGTATFAAKVDAAAHAHGAPGFL